MSTRLSHTAQHLLAELGSILNRDLALQVLLKLQPLIADRHLYDVNTAIVNLMPEQYDSHCDNLMQAIERDPDQLFAIVCYCVSEITGIKTVGKIRSRRAPEVHARYFVLFIMCEELHSIGRITYRDIQKMFDGKIHHASIIHARHMIEGYLASDQFMRKQLIAITNMLATYGHWKAAAKINSIEPLWKTPSA
jgi:hypothetical protein